jgi:hypothetical protein
MYITVKDPATNKPVKLMLDMNKAYSILSAYFGATTDVDM